MTTTPTPPTELLDPTPTAGEVEALEESGYNWIEQAQKTLDGALLYLRLGDGESYRGALAAVQRYAAWAAQCPPDA